MERHEVLEMMSALKLSGMRSAFDEILANGLKRRAASRASTLATAVPCAAPSRSGDGSTPSGGISNHAPGPPATSCTNAPPSRACGSLSTMARTAASTPCSRESTT